MDEVFFPFAAHFAEHHNQQHGTNLTYVDITSYNFEDIIGEDILETVKRVHAATEVDHSHIDPIEGSPDAVRQLEKQFDLVIVTARDPKHEEQTLDWLERHYRDVFSDVIHVGHIGAVEKPIKKVEICRQLAAIALIDDSPKHIEEVANAGIEGVLFGNYAWNQDKEFENGVLPERVTRQANWPAVLEHFDVRG